MLLVYSVYLAILPVLFAVVFMHLKVGSAKLVVATMACVIFMALPFVIVITNIHTHSVNCGSWNYPELKSGRECYNVLTGAFRVAFAVSIAGLAVPVIYLIRGRQPKGSVLLRTLIACASFVMTVFIFFRGLVRRQTRDDRNAPTDDTVPAAINKFLLPHEREVITVQRHPAVLIGPGVLALDGLVAAGVLTSSGLHHNGPLLAAVWITWLALVARMIWKTIDWADGYFVVTSQRLMLVRGVLTKKVNMLPLSKVTDMSFHRSSTGRLLGFGEFIIELATGDQALRTVDYLPYPEQLYLEICGLIFKDHETEESDTGDD